MKCQTLGFLGMMMGVLGCNNDFAGKTALLCSNERKVCVVYPTHCNGLARALSYVGNDGWTVLINTNAAGEGGCSVANPTSCASVEDDGVEGGQVVLNIGLGTMIGKSNVEMRPSSVGRLAVFAVPQRTLGYAQCMGLVVGADNVTMRGFVVDMRNCTDNAQGIVGFGENMQLYDVGVLGAATGIVLWGTGCGQTTLLDNVMVRGALVFLAAGCSGTVVVRDGEGGMILLMRATTAVVVVAGNTTGMVQLALPLTASAALAVQKGPCGYSTCSTCKCTCEGAISAAIVLGVVVGVGALVWGVVGLVERRRALKRAERDR